MRKVWLLFTLAVLSISTSRADPSITLTGVTPLTLSGPPGTSETFTGTLTNTGDTELTLSYGFYSAQSVDWSWVDNSPYYVLQPGASFTGDLVTFTIRGGVAPGPYTEFFGFGYTWPPDPGWEPTVVDTNQVDFTVNVGETPISATPEPSSFLLLGSGLASFVGILRRKLKA